MALARIHLRSICSLLAASAAPGLSFAQVADSWSISGDVMVTATNSDAPVTLAPADGALMSGVSIADGSRNTISANAVGASASVSYSSASSLDAAMTDSVDGDVTVSALNLASDVSVVGTIEGASISAGHDNTISVASVGASAQLAVTDDVLGGAVVNRSLGVNGDVTLNAENTASVTVQTEIGAGGQGPEITGGTRNAFSVTAVGASAGISTVVIVDDGTYTSDVSIGAGGQISISAKNSGDVILGSLDDPAVSATLDGATITTDSVDGSISFMAIGASGSISSTTIAYAGTADSSVTLGEVAFDVENTGAVQANVTITNATIDGKNSISAGAIGSVINNSATSVSYAQDVMGTNGTYDAVTYATANSGSIHMAGGLANAGIADGAGLSISVNAVGASSAFTPR